MLTQRTYRPLIVGVAVVLAALVFLRTVDGHRRDASVTVSAPLVLLSPVGLAEYEVRDRDIAFYAQRAREDQQGASDRLTLATLLFHRSRVAGSRADLAQAESLSRMSASLREQRNGQALEVLATILMARHA